MYQALNFEKIDKNFYQVKLLRNNEDIYYMDFSIDNNDPSTEWNQYIFDMNNSNDIEREKIQNDFNEFEAASTEAIYYLLDKKIIKQDKTGNWKYCSLINFKKLLKIK